MFWFWWGKIDSRLHGFERCKYPLPNEALPSETTQAWSRIFFMSAGIRCPWESRTFKPWKSPHGSPPETAARRYWSNRVMDHTTGISIRFIVTSQSLARRKNHHVRSTSLQGLLVVNSCCRCWRFGMARNKRTVQSESLVLVASSISASWILGQDSRCATKKRHAVNVSAMYN